MGGKGILHQWPVSVVYMHKQTLSEETNDPLDKIPEGKGQYQAWCLAHSKLPLGIWEATEQWHICTHSLETGIFCYLLEPIKNDSRWSLHTLQRMQ